MSQSMDSAARKFDVGDAAFHVFKHAGTGRRGGLTLIFAVYVIVHALLFAAALWVIYPFFANFPALVENEPATFSDFMAQTGRLWLLAIGGFLFTWIFYAVIDAALLRWFYGRSAMPRFGEAEFQLMIIAVFWAILLPLLWLPNAALWAFALALESTLLLALAIFFILISLWLTIWAMVKFAPAAALTVHDKRFSFFRAFGATKNVFWAMLGAFLIAMVIYLALSIVVSTLSQIALIVSAGLSFGDKLFIDPDTVSDAEIAALVQQFFSRDVLIILAVLTLLSLIPQFLLQASFAGINAYRVKQRQALETPPDAGPDPRPQPEPDPAPEPAAEDAEEEPGVIPVASASAPLAVAVEPAESGEDKSDDRPETDKADESSSQDPLEDSDNAESETSGDAVTGAIAALDRQQNEQSDPSAAEDAPVERRDGDDREGSSKT